MVGSGCGAETVPGIVALFPRSWMLQPAPPAAAPPHRNRRPGPFAPADLHGSLRSSAGVGGVTSKLEARMSLGHNGAATRSEDVGTHDPTTS